MYSYEISQYINDKNCLLSREEIKYITDVFIHTQISHIIYNPWDDSYNMWDCDGNKFSFRCKGE